MGLEITLKTALNQYELINHKTNISLWLHDVVDGVIVPGRVTVENLIAGITLGLDEVYAPNVHDHDDAYAALGHNHDSEYAAIDHLSDAAAHPGLFAPAVLAYQHDFWATFSYTGTGDMMSVFPGTISPLLPVAPGTIKLNFGACFCPNYGGTGVWAIFFLSQVSSMVHVLKKDLSLGQPSIAGIQFQAYAVTGGYSVRMQFSHAIVTELSRTGIAYKWVCCLSPSNWP